MANQGIFGPDWMAALKKNFNVSEPYWNSWMSGYKKGGDKGAKAFQGMLQGKEGLSPSIQRSMGQNTLFTDNFNAMVGAQQPQGINFNNDWMQRNLFGMDSGPSLPQLGPAQGVGGDASAAFGGDWVPSLPGSIGERVGEVGGKVSRGLESIGINPGMLAAGAAEPLVKGLTGSRLGGRAAGAAATTGMAAAQGFMNPVSDIAALMSILKLAGLFG